MSASDRKQRNVIIAAVAGTTAVVGIALLVWKQMNRQQQGIPRADAHRSAQDPGSRVQDAVEGKPSDEGAGLCTPTSTPPNNAQYEGKLVDEDEELECEVQARIAERERKAVELAQEKERQRVVEEKEAQRQKDEAEMKQREATQTELRRKLSDLNREEFAARQALISDAARGAQRTAADEQSKIERLRAKEEQLLIDARLAEEAAAKRAREEEVKRREEMEKLEVRREEAKKAAAAAAEASRKKEAEAASLAKSPEAKTPPPSVAASSPQASKFHQESITPHRQRSCSVKLATPLKGGHVSSETSWAVLGLQVPAVDGFHGADTNPFAHFPVAKERFLHSDGAELTLVAEDLSLIEGTMSDESFVNRSLDALFSLADFDTSRVQLVNKVRASEILQSPFQWYADIKVQAPRSQDQNIALYVAALFVVVDRVGYTYQLMCPSTQRERFIDSFYASATNTKIDHTDAMRSPLGGKLHFTAEEVDDGVTLAAPLDMIRIPSPPGSDADALLRLKSRWSSLSAIVDRSPVSTGSSEQVAKLSNGYFLHVTGAEAAAADLPIVEVGHVPLPARDSPTVWYVSPVVRFPLPNDIKTFVVEHKFGDGVFSLFLDLNSVPQLAAKAQSDSRRGSSGSIAAATARFIDLTVGFLFAEKENVSDWLSRECISGDALDVDDDATKELPNLSIDGGEGPLRCVFIMGQSRVLGEDTTLHFGAVEVSDGEWLVLRWTIPRGLGAQHPSVLKYITSFLGNLCLL